MVSLFLCGKTIPFVLKEFAMPLIVALTIFWNLYLIKGSRKTMIDTKKEQERDELHRMVKQRSKFYLKELRLNLGKISPKIIFLPWCTDYRSVLITIIF